LYEFVDLEQVNLYDDIALWQFQFGYDVQVNGPGLLSSVLGVKKKKLKDVI
jgi:hypothetical protein